ncbi:hypothetical protein C8F01DRAFT_997366 [Mycena amicta]|nr:hypothetical protein C8F01DRAFT_997366 [Mycena amicta]
MAGKGDQDDGADIPFTIVRPSNCADWLEKFLVEACRHDLGPLFRQLVEAVAALEHAYGYANVGKLPLKERPSQFGVWFRDGRKWIQGHDGIRFKGNTETFAERFHSWWSEMQPEWRARGVDGKYERMAAAGRSWGAMGSPGKDGMLLVVAALGWWGREEGKSRSPAWTAAAEEVLWALRALTADAAATLSHVRSGAEVVKRVGKKQKKR